MTIEITREPDEMLVRWRSGVVSGAHYREIETIRDGDTVISVREGPVLPLTAGSAELETLLGQVATGLAAQVEALETERTVLHGRIAELEAGGPAPLPAGVVPMRAARLAMIQAGIFQQVDDTIQAMQGVEGDVARTEWGYSRTLRRDHPLTAAIASVIGYTDEQTDALFAVAAAMP